MWLPTCSCRGRLHSPNLEPFAFRSELRYGSPQVAPEETIMDAAAAFGPDFAEIDDIRLKKVAGARGKTRTCGRVGG
jgi:hypothetical protein